MLKLATSVSVLALVCAAVSLPVMAQAPKQPPAALPDGPGKDLVQGMCTACHQTTEIIRSMGYTKDQWKELVNTMVDMRLTPQEENQVTSYLAQHFPPSNKREAKRVPGPHEIEIKSWRTVKFGQRARDPIEHPDGSIWYVGQWGNNIGRIDQKTGEVKEWDLPPKSLPHSVMIDRKGGIWFLGNGNGTVGKFDPVSGKATIFKMPDEKAKDPHTGEFDTNNIFWFTLQQSDMIGRLNPETGEVKLVSTKPIARPYGIKFAADGTPWVACNGNNSSCLYKVDKTTMALTEVKLPTPGTSVRRIDIAPDGRVWFVNSGKGKIGVVDPTTMAIREWDSPSGPDSHPYGINVMNDVIWYNESGVRPDMLVRFDPRTEQFQSWPLASSGGVHAGIHRNGHVTRDGQSLLLHQSATNTITKVTPKPPAVR